MIVPARTGVRRRCTCLLFYCCYRRAEEAVVDTVVENVSNSPNLFCGPHFQTSRSLFTREKYLVVRTDDGHTENNKENNKAFYSVAGYIHTPRITCKRQKTKRQKDKKRPATYRDDDAVQMLQSTYGLAKQIEFFS